MTQTNQSDTEIRMKYERSFTRWKEMPIATIPTPNGMPPTDTLPVIPPHIADSVDISTCNMRCDRSISTCLRDSAGEGNTFSSPPCYLPPHACYTISLVSCIQVSRTLKTVFSRSPPYHMGV